MLRGMQAGGAAVGVGSRRWVLERVFRLRRGTIVPTGLPLPLLGPAGPDVDVELARIQRIPIADATAVTQLVVPTHPAANRRVFEEDAALIRTANDEHMAALKAEVAALRAEMGSMVAACQRMLDMALTTPRRR